MSSPLALTEDQQRDIVADSSGTASLPRTQRLLLAIVAVELVLVYAPTVLWLIDRWTMSVWHNAHGMLIPFVVGYFAYEELKRVPDRGAESSPFGFVFLIPALALHALDTGIHTQLLSAVSLVLMLPGLSLLFLGRTRTRAIAFPLGFMALMLPIPLALTEPLHLFLRQIATGATSVTVPLLGITAFTEGTTIHLAKASLVVGDACSGFSTLYAAVAVAALTAYSCSSAGRRLVVLVSAVPIAVAANIVRVILLVIVVDRTGIDVLSTWLHPASGVLTFALALPLIFWLGSTPNDRVRS